MLRKVFVCAALLLVSRSASAQNSWEFDVHIGGAAVIAAAGSASLPAPGPSFTTTTDLPSREVPSWYFGDGVSLINGVLSAFRAPERMSALDPVLAQGLAERRSGSSLGIRISRIVTRRLRAEFSLDVSAVPLELSDASVAQVEAANNGLVSAIGGALASAPITNGSVTSEFEIQHGAGRQLTATGALAINLTTRDRLAPYVTVGAGVISNRGDSPRVTLDGNYSFLFDGTAFAERDHVLVRHLVESNAFVGVFGGGITHALTQRSGLRADVRVHMGKDTTRTWLNANPERQYTMRRLSLASRTSPSVQFSTVEGPGTSTLNGGVSNFETFRADGTFTQILVSVGYFWRF